MKKWIRKMLAGDHVISEYSTVTVPGIIQEKVFLEVSGLLIDVSQLQWLLSIEPVVFGVWIEQQEHKAVMKSAATCKLYFTNDSKEGTAPPISIPVESILSFTHLQAIEEQAGTLFLLKLEKSHIHQLNAVKRYLLFHRYYKKNGLNFQQFKSFVAAYSYPRRIRIISFRQDDYYNIFPMDLLGNISIHNRFVFGLRHSNITLPKIIAAGKLVVAEVPFEQKRAIYQLGAHHSSNPPTVEALPFKTILSKEYGFNIPDWAFSYREISLIKTINLGSHMLLWGTSSKEQVLQPATGHLYLEHFLHYLYQNECGQVYQLI